LAEDHLPELPEEISSREYNCNLCGSQYKVNWEPDEVDLIYTLAPEFCPFCGEKDEEVDEDLGIDFKDKVSFGKGVDMMDQDEEEDDQ
jgi:DNA-directed RNA polymerase subunit RPC12/RpoP